MALAQVQFNENVVFFAPPFPTLLSAPTVGNLILAVWSDVAGSTLDTTNWTPIASFGPEPGGTEIGYASYRYVQAGDGTTLPNLSNSNGIYRIMCHEVSGVSGTWAADLDQYKVETVYPPTAFNTASANELAFFWFFAGNGGSSYTPGSGWTNDYFDSHAHIADHALLATSGTSAVDGGTLGATQGSAFTLALRLPSAGVNYSLSVDAGLYGYTGYTTRQPQFISFPVATGIYHYTGIALIPPPHRLTFSEFNNDGFVDWTVEPFNSYLRTYQIMPDPSRWMGAPFIYTFLREGTGQQMDTDEDGNVIIDENGSAVYSGSSSAGATLKAAWNWANDDTSPKVSENTQVYQFRNGSLVSVARRKLRGKGRALQLIYENDGEKDFNILGWAVFLTQNGGQ